MSAPTWYLPAGRFSAVRHLRAPSGQSYCEVWNLDRASVETTDENDGRIPCGICITEYRGVGVGTSTVSGEQAAPLHAPPSPLTVPAPRHGCRADCAADCPCRCHW